jgi:zinc/manganese transport system substrate-binding protein
VKVKQFIWLAVWLGFGGGVELAHAQGHKLKVVTSFLPVYCFTVNVAGDLAQVDNLLPPGAEPHDFQFSPREMKQLEAADLVVVNGLGLEAWLGRVVSSQTHPKKIVEAAEGLQSELITTAPYLDLENAGASVSSATESTNPHIWLDPQLAEHAVGNILLALQHADPANADGYARNAAAYIARLEKLDAELRAGLAPLKGQPLITFHDAFPYFARRYELKIVGVVEKVPEVQPSPKYLSALRRVIAAEHVKAIFTEKQSSPKLAEQIGVDYHVAVGELDTLETGELKVDAYEQGMRANLAALEKYLR